MKFCVLVLCVVFALAQAAEEPGCVLTGYGNDPLCTAWMFNNVNTSAYFSGVLSNVQNATVVNINGKPYMQISATGIPQYDHVMTSSEVSWLNSRPKASIDFSSGRTTAVSGQTVQFGESIGYSSTHCTLGYWPPGPVCPSSSAKIGKFPISPIHSNTTCYTGLGAVGYWVNGVSVYNWWDGTSYNSQNVWHTLAAIAETYDMDICWGHAANGDYHHHFYPNCLAEILGDTGAHKSPIYGFAADGYPILGPYVSAGVLAKSCWKTRNYASATSTTGCGQANKRTCLLVNNLDISKGTTTTSNPGPDTTATVISQSENSFTATSGYYYEDYYYDSSCTSQGDEYLDQYNGRYDSTYGYVYHVVIENTGGVYPSSPFPHYIGPVFYGQLDSNTVTRCSANPFTSGGGGEQPPAPDNSCCPDGSIPTSGNPPCKSGPPSPVYCNTAHHH